MLAERPPALSDARRLSQRVHFERDGTVSVASGKVELGRGILTALAQIAAEELGVPLAKIRMLPASTAYSPDEGVTSGSLSIQDAGKALRKACAELRALLKLSGAASYWDLELATDIPADAPEKPPAEYRIVGTSAARLDLGQARRPAELCPGHGAPGHVARTRRTSCIRFQERLLSVRRTEKRQAGTGRKFPRRACRARRGCDRRGGEAARNARGRPGRAYRTTSMRG